MHTANSNFATSASLLCESECQIISMYLRFHASSLMLNEVTRFCFFWRIFNHYKVRLDVPCHKKTVIKIEHVNFATTCIVILNISFCLTYVPNIQMLSQQWYSFVSTPSLVTSGKRGTAHGLRLSKETGKGKIQTRSLVARR